MVDPIRISPVVTCDVEPKNCEVANRPAVNCKVEPKTCNVARRPGQAGQQKAANDKARKQKRREDAENAAQDIIRQLPSRFRGKAQEAFDGYKAGRNPPNAPPPAPPADAPRKPE